MSEKVQPLRVYLLKKNVKDYNDALKDATSLEEYELRRDLNYDGKLYVAETSETTPSWRQFLENITELSLDNLINRHNSAVLFIKRSNRIFAVTFGYGRALLEPNAYERDFGLKIVMNVVDPEKLRSIDAHTMEEIPVQTRRQASKASSLDVFGVNVVEDMLRAVTGAPKETLPDDTKTNLGKAVSGSSAVAVRPLIALEELGTFCNKLKSLYGKKYYRDNGFEWVDNLSIVKDLDLIEKLDDKLLMAMQKEETEKIHLAPPEPIAWEDLEYFKYSCDTSHGEYADIDIVDFYDVCHDASALHAEDLARIKINAFFAGGGSEKSRFAIRDCVVFDTSYHKKRYVLTNGMWFEINKTFGDKVLGYVEKLSEAKIKLPDATDGEKEGDYNERAAASSDSYVLLDKKTIKPSDGRTQIEVCDIFSKKGQFVHVKSYKGSSTLSHLFAQGTVSADLFQNDQGFRTRMRGKVKPESTSHAALIPRDEPTTKDFEVVYAIIKKPSSGNGKWQSKLPFFAQLHLMQSAIRLHSQGYKVAVKLIKRMT